MELQAATTDMSSLPRMAFLAAAPVHVGARAHTAVSARRPRGVHRGVCRSVLPRASLAEDFRAGPSYPPHPRSLTSVIVLSSLTGLAWYGWYKFCVEEELRAELQAGPGGYVALGPFGAALALAAVLPRPLPAEAAVAFAVVWIVGVQYGLYKRINKVCEREGMGTPLTPEWVVLPGFNLVVGLRSIHFLSKAWGAGDDLVVDRLPFLGKDTLGVAEMITNPKLWLKL